MFFSNYLDDFLGVGQLGYTCKTKDENYEFSMDLPGYSKKEINVSAERDLLNITAENKARGKVTKTFSLPEDVDTNGIKGSCSDGVLTLTIPRAKRLPGRVIKIE